ncbi:putative glycolipid-binding domain-containing protein [Ferrovibrio sp.]|uniref:putative glycolipid-binding domain-containing protein n=1 Tax=Ferrovibrio sp. TaxID=1917215 RepID=UPI00262F0415|nr:putative glycolipid-binding domain-containing protein [Ferrovibrio sp.]
MADLAFWECLYTPGHDAACLIRQGVEGWLLHGTAVFRHEAGPARVNYTVELDGAWRTIRGTVRGYLADRPVDHVIERQPGGWHLDGRRVEGLDHLVDLDYGFTPATNMQQLRRAALQPGHTLDLPAAWFDLGMTSLIELPQRYTCRDAATYHYESPAASYEAILEIAPNGFVRTYPHLWRMAP